MRASFVEFHRKRKQILAAIDRNESVTLLYRGKEKAILVPKAATKRGKAVRIEDTPFFGMWKDRTDMEDIEAWRRRLWEGRAHAG